MAKPIKFADIEAQIDQLHNSVTKIAGWYHNSGDYTPEGRASKYAAALDDQRFNYRGKAAALSQLINNLAPAAQAKAAKVRDGLLPVAKDPTEQLAAELQAQRLMGRATEQSDIMNLVEQSDPSPGLTLAIEEWQARGQLKDEYADAVLMSKSPEYQAAQTEVKQVTQMAGFLRQRMEKTNAQMDTPVPKDRGFTPSMEMVEGDGWPESIAVDEVPSGAFGEVTVDPVYRNA